MLLGKCTLELSKVKKDFILLLVSIHASITFATSVSTHSAMTLFLQNSVTRWPYQFCHIRPFVRMKIYPKHSFCQSRFKRKPKTKWTIKKLPKTLNYVAKVAKFWPNLVTLYLGKWQRVVTLKVGKNNENGKKEKAFREFFTQNVVNI